MKSLIFSSMLINLIMLDGFFRQTGPGRRPLSGTCGLVETAQVHRQALDGMIFFDKSSRLRSNSGSKITVAQESSNRSYLGVEVVVFNEKPGFPISYDLRHASNICCDDWQTGGHGLQQ